MKVDIKEIAAILGMAEKHIPMLVGAFLDESKSILQNLTDAVSANNFTDIALHAHNIKGSAANLRLTDVSEIALGLERAAKASDGSYDYEAESSKLAIFIADIEL